ncbi:MULTISPECIES: methyltransferase family protein [Rodentibacter]|uniref:methyltransferase family protein n=1 Tax=Rodentibacter TaxID=1960084 RepID=UPI0027E49E1C|nr:isoprenylcysteine carboxylmethyltransferase family protein [Rodentibacter sp. JRC1]
MLFPLPPILCVFIGTAMYFLPLIGQYPRNPYLISIFILLSGAIAIASVWQFYRYKANIDPQQLDKTTTLVTSGIFRISRNPMYLSLLLMLSGWALWLGNLLSWAGVATFVFLMNRFQISQEEAYLERQFGEDYRRYKSKVRRWI